jgi:hypothetical protein
MVREIQCFITSGPDVCTLQLLDVTFGPPVLCWLGCGLVLPAINMLYGSRLQLIAMFLFNYVFVCCIGYVGSCMLICMHMYGCMT